MIDQNKINYVLFHFRLLYGAEAANAIAYGFDGLAPHPAGQARVRIKKYTGNFFDVSASFPEKVIRKKWNGIEVPFLFDEDQGNIIEVKDGSVYINYDIIASAFYFLSGWQEYFTGKKDIHDRFPWHGSLHQQLGITGIPVVNYYFDILRSAVEKATGRPVNLIVWNGNPPFVSFVSHDIDKCESGWKEGTMSELKRGNVLSPFRLIGKKLFGEDAWFNFNELMEADRSFGVRSTYYFIPRYGKVNGIWNADYPIQSHAMQKILSAIEREQCETGIHGSFGTHKNHGQLKKELELLGKPVTGNRFHFLKFDINVSPDILADAGIRYDASIGFAEKPGFRNGFCFPFYLYDLKRNRMRNILEIPLMVMDATLFEKKYLGLKPHEAMELIKPILAEIKKFGGLFSLLWHNTSISEYKYRGWKKVYLDILKYLSDENTLFLHGKAIYEVVEQNSTMQ